MLGVATGGGTTALVNASQCVDLQFSHLVILAVAAGDATSAAIGLSRLALGCTIRDCTLVAERGVVALEGDETFLLTANLRIVDSLFFCSQRGVSLDGITLHYGEVRVAGNLLLRCDEAGVTMTGGAFPNASVTIAGNVMQVTGAGVRAGTDGLRIDANEIVGTPTARAPADAIVLEQGFGKGAIDHAMITGNRIRGFTGNGIAIRHTLGRAMIKSNVIESVGRAAIVMEADASAAYLCIENNHFSDLGTGFNAAAEPYFGVHLLGAARADVASNVFANVARQATQSPGRAALALQACAEVRVAGNRFFGIGPDRFVGRTIAIAAAATFRQLAVDDNSAARIGDSAAGLLPAQWQAIVVGTRPPPDSPGGIVATPGVIVALLNENAVYLSAFRVGLLSALQGTASVRGNRLRSQLTDRADGRDRRRRGLPAEPERCGGDRDRRRRGNGARHARPVPACERRRQPGGTSESGGDLAGDRCDPVRGARQHDERGHPRQRRPVAGAVERAQRTGLERENRTCA